MGLIDDLIIGNKYTKDYFGISYPATLASEHIIEGKATAFFTMNNQDEFKNEIHADGFVYEFRETIHLPPWGFKSRDSKHVFIRENPNEDFIYYGRSKHKERYSETQIKIFW